MAPSIRYARDLVEQGYVGKVLGTAIVGSGIAWTTVSDSAHTYMFDAQSNANLLSVPVMHAIDAMQFVVGDLTDVRATSAVRNPVIRLADTEQDIQSTTPDHCAIAATLESGAVASIFYRGGTSRGENFRWEINGSDGDLVLTSPVGNLQVLAPNLFGGRGEDAAVAPLDIPSEYDLAPAPSKGLAPMLHGFMRPSPAISGMAHRAQRHRISRTLSAFTGRSTGSRTQPPAAWHKLSVRGRRSPRPYDQPSISSTQRARNVFA